LITGLSIYQPLGNPKSKKKYKKISVCVYLCLGEEGHFSFKSHLQFGKQAFPLDQQYPD
jgi:hypothetical protein